jgi:hypothetical protein
VPAPPAPGSKKAAGRSFASDPELQSTSSGSAKGATPVISRDRIEGWLFLATDQLGLEAAGVEGTGELGVSRPEAPRPG